MVDRYSKQTMLSQVGREGQNKLARASVVVIGAGGLGTPVLTYLVAAGVGRVGLIDFDTVSLSNLNRQFLYDDVDVGRSKAETAKEKLRAMNGSIEIIAHEERLTDENAGALLHDYELVIGAVDSLHTRHVINKAAVAAHIPYIDGGVNGFCGCIMFSYPTQTPCLNCVFPSRDTDKKPVGILGATAGVIGTLEANIALLWLLNQENPIENELLFYDGLAMSFDHIRITRDSNCRVCNGGIL